MTTAGPVASVLLDAFDRGPETWRQTKKALCRWQATGRAHLEILDRPVDLVSIARAVTIDDLPRPAGCPESTSFVIVVYDPPLAHGLVRLAAMFADRDRPPPDPPTAIGSQP